MARAEDLGQPFNLALALNFYQFLGWPQELYEAASRIVAISAENGFPQWVATGLTMQGWAQIAGAEAAAPEPAEATLERMRRALDGYRASGARLAQSFAYSMLIDAWMRHGDLARARDILDEAFERARDVGDRFWHAELHRLSGEIRLAMAPDGAMAEPEKAAAQADFSAARDLARQQGAVALELRAVESLGRLWRLQGEEKQAEELLAEIRARLPDGGVMTAGDDDG